jgi:quercetin dioxygenase-like cupin family protein
MLPGVGRGNKMNRIRTTVLTGILVIAPMRVQDSATMPGYSVKVEFENEQIRVTRVRYAPRAKSPMHSHTGRAVVAITPSHLRVTTSDGTTRETERRAGEIYWGDSVRHSAENLTDAPLETVEVEVKQANAPAVNVAVRPVDSSKLKEPVPVEQEPHHHVVFQNQFVRVLDVLFPPGDPALFHTHSNDNVSIALSGDLTKSQVMGGEWSAPVKVVPGEVGFHKAKGQPYTHRVGSAGEKPFHVIDVEIFPEASK